MRASILAGLMGVVLAGCGDMLSVSDPQRYTSEYLDNSLDAVINGVEGDLYAEIDELVNFTALNSDELQHSGTWVNWDDLDHGRIIYSNSAGDGIMNSLLRTRFFAQTSQECFDRVLGEASATSPLTARARTIEGWANLLLAQNFCEAPAAQGGPAVSDEEIAKAAVAVLTDALQKAQAAGLPDLAHFAQAGRARAHLLLGDYGAALTDAQAVPTSFAWDAEFSSNSGRQYNSLVQLATVGQNRAASVREFYWDRVDLDARAMRDPYTAEIDQRLAVYFDGAIAVDGLTPHYSQWKFQELGSNIQLTDGKEMRLIEAEVAWRNNDLVAALEKINEVRVLADLTPHAAAGDAAQVFKYLLHARFAELFLEGQRMSDLYRFGVVDDFIAEGRFGEETENPRPTKFPISETEVLNNASFADKGTAGRCLPLSS